MTRRGLEASNPRLLFGMWKRGSTQWQAVLPESVNVAPLSGTNFQA
jgi:hypothetical protein